MKKLFGAIFLVAVLLAVSYFKIIRDESRVDTAFQEGHQQATEDQADFQVEIDSLAELVEQYKVAIEDSQCVWAERSLEGSDSLTAELASRDDIIDSLRERQSATEKALAAAKKSSNDKLSKKFSHREILTYYKQRYQALPADLSPYEKRIALGEIRDESARKFSISVEDLRKIRETNNINY